MDYNMIAHPDSVRFSVRCAEMCKLGYKPYGHPFSKGGMFCQAFIKEERNSKPLVIPKEEEGET